VASSARRRSSQRRRVSASMAASAGEPPAMARHCVAEAHLASISEAVTATISANAQKRRGDTCWSYARRPWRGLDDPVAARVAVSVKDPTRYNRRAVRLLSVAPLLFLAACSGVAPPHANEGVLDLSGWDFATNGAVVIKGEWLFNWNELVAPGANVPPDGVL